jgi:hypothetical protein
MIISQILSFLVTDVLGVRQLTDEVRFAGNIYDLHC